jgi:hypothetical protein
VIVSVGSARGAPGVTSWALLLAAAWPSTVERVVVEADPDGGVLGVRYDLGVEPGLVSLLAALRRSTGEIPLEVHARRCGDLWVVPGPATGEQARRVLASAGDGIPGQLADDGRLWVVDAGRMHAANPSIALVARSALTVLVSGPRHEDLVQLPARVAALPGPVAVLVVGRSGHGEDELAGFTGAAAVWKVGAVDDLPVQAGRLLVPGRARRSWLWRQAVDVASAAALLAPLSPAPATERTVSDRSVDDHTRTDTGDDDRTIDDSEHGGIGSSVDGATGVWT